MGAMTKHLALGSLALLLATPAAAQKLAPESASGRWSGTGTFFKSDLAEKTGPIPIVLDIRSGKLVSGTVGAATMAGAPVNSGRSLLQIGAGLTGVVGPAPELAKDHVTFLITAITDTTLKGEFHLKSNRMFDARVREGRFVLKRTSR